MNKIITSISFTLSDLIQNIIDRIHYLEANNPSSSNISSWYKILDSLKSISNDIEDEIQYSISISRSIPQFEDTDPIEEIEKDPLFIKANLVIGLYSISEGYKETIKSDDIEEVIKERSRKIKNKNYKINNPFYAST